MRQVSTVLIIVYGIAVLVVVAWPTPVDSGSGGLLFRALRVLHQHGLPEFVSYNVVEFAANIAMFVPLGVLIALLFGPRWWWVTIVACLALSISIEVYQYQFLPYRYATVRDVLANSAGGAIGAIAAVIAIAWLRRSWVEEEPR
ncbi:VanZ family protein [Herbiconiux sp. CPCC 205763]|uniref:VanZ family protein n=1 Tax=Herbiconiux aconitum TaxID=2970913 RepID=A0ABT2GKL2_9MICO|nr:VanZ family protein [Herbiconiux aconitum]MCS5716750.1 VanZ family protein [Herbiconiux aconitum]